MCPPLDYYQREYTWGSENVRRLVEDLHRRFSAEWNALHDRRDTSRYKPYFLGPYVYFQDGDITYLVDGQQRVTTLHLLLIHIRNLLVDHDAPGEAVDLLKSFLLARSEQTRPRRLNETWRKAMTGLSALGGMGAATDFANDGRFKELRDELIRAER